MPNPLRLPIVLIAIFGLMLYYVHQHHLRHGGEDRPFRPLFEHEDLQLRQPHGQGARATVLSPLSIAPRDVARAKPDVDQSQHDRSPAAARLPSLNDRPWLALTEGSAGATLLPPTSPYSKLTGQAAPPTGNAAPQSVAPTESGHATEPAAPAAYEACRTSTEVLHRIVDGDTLPGLAKAYLGDASRYPELLEANRDVLLHPDLLPLGVRIRIPLSGEPN